MKTIFEYIFFNSSKDFLLANRPLKYKIDWSNPNKHILPTTKRNVREKSYWPTIFGLKDFVKKTVKPNKRRAPETLKNKVTILCFTKELFLILSKILFVFNWFHDA
ncbi:hypothetical protein JOD96_000714 [Flavobacterium sp. 1355]|nr:hypothetical protein [Flavobacterium sp. 1355]